MSKENRRKELYESLDLVFQTGYQHVDSVQMGMPSGRIDMFEVLICVDGKIWEPTGNQVSLSYPQIQKRKTEGHVFFPKKIWQSDVEKIENYVQ